MRRPLVDDADLGGIIWILPFLVIRHFDVPEHEHEHALLARLQVEARALGRDRVPAVRHRVAHAAFGDRLRAVPAIELAEELVAARVESDRRLVHREERVVVAALLELGLVVDDGVGGGLFDFDFAGRQVALEIARVVHRVPQAPFHAAGHVHRHRFAGVVLDRKVVDLGGRVQRYERGESGSDALVVGMERGVSNAVAAFVRIERRLGRQERGRPCGHQRGVFPPAAHEGGGF